MKAYIFIFIALFISVLAHSQKLMIEIDVVGDFVAKIIIDDNSSITLNQKGDVLNVTLNSKKCNNSFSSGLKSSIHDLNGGRISRIGGLDIEYDFHTKKISEIGDIEIDYDFHTKRISKIGDVEFEYDFHTKKISEIGALSIDYDFHSKKISDIGDVKFSYYFPSKRLESVESKEFKYEFEDEKDAFDIVSNDRYPKCNSNRILFTYGGILFSLKIR